MHLSFLLLILELEACHDSGQCAQMVANLCKSAVNAPVRKVRGHLGCNPKVMLTCNLGFLTDELFKILVALILYLKLVY